MEICESRDFFYLAARIGRIARGVGCFGWGIVFFLICFTQEYILAVPVELSKDLSSCGSNNEATTRIALNIRNEKLANRGFFASVTRDDSGCFGTRNERLMTNKMVP